MCRLVTSPLYRHQAWSAGITSGDRQGKVTEISFGSMSFDSLRSFASFCFAKAVIQ